MTSFALRVGRLAVGLYEKLNVVILSQEANVDVLTIRGKATPADTISLLIHDLGLSPLHSQVEIAVIGVHAVLHLCPQENRDRLIVYVNRLTVFDH